MTREWIQRAWADNPNRIMPSGQVLTGPVRTAFCNVLDRPKNKDGTERAWGTVLLFPDHTIPGVNLNLLAQPINALLDEKAPGARNNPVLRAKYHDPFKKQEGFVDLKTGELYDGFVPGRFAISVNSSQTKPPVFDQNYAPIVDKSRIYSGCWVIANLNPGWIGRDDKKGPTYYLNALVVVADDENLGGIGVVNPQAAFEGVKIDPTVNPSALFGAGEKTESPAPDIFS